MWNQAYFWFTWLAVACFMEIWAMILHGILWHGPWWVSHKSHHEPRHGRFEVNDIFALFHAILATSLIIYGCESGESVLSHLCVATGFGMTTFGMAYFVVHDGFIHERLPVAFLAKIPYLRRVRNAHKVHHRRTHQSPYGLFLGEQELRWHKRKVMARRLQSTQAEDQLIRRSSLRKS